LNRRSLARRRKTRDQIIPGKFGETSPAGYTDGKLYSEVDLGAGGVIAFPTCLGRILVLRGASRIIGGC